MGLISRVSSRTYSSIMSRPEHIAPPEFFYNETEAKKYTQNSRIITIQSELTQRAIELCQLPMLDIDYESDSDDMNESEPQVQTDPKLVLDILAADQAYQANSCQNMATLGSAATFP